VTGADGSCTFVNQRWCALTGGTPAEFIGVSWLAAIHPRDRERLRREFGQAVAGGRELRAGCRLRPARQATARAHAAVSASAGDAGPPGEFLVVLTGVTGRARVAEPQQRGLSDLLAAWRAAEGDRRRLAEENTRLRAQDELKTNFLATVSHELRGPLTSIVSYTELIADERDRLSPEVAGFVDVVGRSAGQLTRLVSDLLLLSRIDAGVIPLELAPVAVGEVVAAAVRDRSPAAAQRGVALGCAAGDGPQLRADRARLQQVIDNLLANAIKFTGAGGTVRVSAACTGQWWRIDVADTGAGVPGEELSRLFDRFFRGAGSHADGRPGAGLGLSVVRALTELHGGRVDVASTPGRGTTVRVSLPLQPPAGLAPPPR
jgi:PAS domain S-box-containing protein